MHILACLYIFGIGLKRFTHFPLFLQISKHMCAYFACKYFHPLPKFCIIINKFFAYLCFLLLTLQYWCELLKFYFLFILHSLKFIPIIWILLPNFTKSCMFVQTFLSHSFHLIFLLYICLNNSVIIYKNPAYRRERVSRRVRLIAPILLS